MNRFLTKKKAKRVQPEPKFELDLSNALPSTNELRTSLLMSGLSARFSMLREQDDPNSIIGKASDDSVLEPKRQSRLHEFGFKPSGLDDIAEVASIKSSIRPPFATERSNSYSSEAGYNTDGETETGSIMSRARHGEGNVLFGGRQKITRIAGDGKGRTLYDDDVAMSTFQRWRAEERQREREAANAAGDRKFSFEDEGKSPAKPGSYPTSVAGSLKRQTSTSTATSGQDSRSSTAATSINSQGTPSTAMSPPTGFSSFNFGSSVANAASTASSPQPQDSTRQQQPPPPPPTQSPTPASTPAMERSATKKRLYDQGLNRELQDQQSNALNRLQSFNKRPGANGRTTPDLFQPRNGFPAVDNSIRTGAPAQRSASPTPVSPLEKLNAANGLPGKDVKIGRSNTGARSPMPTSPLPSITPQAKDGSHHEVLSSALNPNDRGKATAMGVFNKPKQFSEQQFLERQRTLRMGRETPTQRENGIDAIAESPKEAEEPQVDGSSVPSPHSAAPTSVSSPATIKTSTKTAPPPVAAPAVPSVAGRPPPPSAWDRSRSVSNGPFNRSRSASNSDQTETPVRPSPFSAFQKAASQLKGGAGLLDEKNDSPQMPPKNKFTFIDDSESDYEDEKAAHSAQAPRNGRLPLNALIPDSAPLAPPPVHEHPAFRNSPQPSREDLRVDVRKPAVETEFRSENKSQPAGVDSPTLPAATSNGLSGMIRHLRNTSATSTYSTMTMQTTGPGATSNFQTRNVNSLQSGSNSAGAVNTAHSSYSHSNPWDLEDFNGEYSVRDSAVSPIEDEGPKDPVAEVAPLRTAQKQDGSQESSWQHELSKKTHTRGGSTETQHEREALANELALRQKAIQEKLRERAESDMRSASPTAGKSQGPFMGILRQKSSFDNFRSRDNSRTRDESRPRAQSRSRGESRPRGEDKVSRILGVNGSSTTLVTGASPSMTGMHDRPSWDTDRGYPPPRSVPMPMPRPSKELQQGGYGSVPGSTPASRPSTGRDSSEDKVRSRSNSNVGTQQRSRSNSEQSNGRSRSRQGRYRDDMAQAGTEATIPEHVPPQGPAPTQPIPEVPESPTQVRGLREYKPVDASTFEQKGLWPPPQNPIVHPLGVPSPRPSPGLAPNGTLSPALNMSSPRPSPGFAPGLSPGLNQMSPTIFGSGRATPNPAFANPTPPLSSSSTPTASSFSASTPNLLAGASMKAARQRKMSIKKSDIGEPVLISTTSVVDTIDLPAGASLKNGMEPPPVPPINPRRKRFAFGRADTEPPEPPFASASYGSGSQSSDEAPKPPRTRHRLKKSSSDGAKIGLYIRAQQEGSAVKSTPALQHLQSSPPRMQNGMF
ncbi:uncharacterized protein PV09_00986 [Verruconis gallopava]|uniref:Uncharacterized protein n=1 Tax=Verruconis gallopava TaxID=253628 RepID=A0A0D1Z523_9PEZI|nr:uncharacterized protein PV09_00986 [Verruconis gallopava]KIW08042.1 hypothetical protein PV09_00986 [Verruconis gallopava]